MFLWTTTLAVWMWIIVTMPAVNAPRGQFFRLLMAIILCGFSAALHRLYRSVRITWAALALLTGLTILACLIVIAFSEGNASALFPWIVNLHFRR